MRAGGIELATAQSQDGCRWRPMIA